MKFKTVKRYVEILTIAVFVVGIFWMIYGTILFKKSSEMDGNECKGLSIFHTQFACLIGFGTFLVVWSAIGLIASCKKINCLLGIYNIGMFLIVSLSLLIFSLAVVLEVYVPQFKEDKDCSKQKILEDLKLLNHNSYQSLCSSDCECLFKGNSTQAMTQNIIKYHSSEGQLKIQDCQIFKNDEKFIHSRKYAELMKSIEISFNCSGVCSVNSYYVFSDVNKEQPNLDCKEEVLLYLDKVIKKVCIAAFVISLLFLFSLICSCCLCFKKKQGMSYYEKNGIGFLGEKQI